MLKRTYNVCFYCSKVAEKEFGSQEPEGLAPKCVLVTSSYIGISVFRPAQHRPRHRNPEYRHPLEYYR